MFWEGRDASLRNHVTQEFHCWRGKNTLTWIDCQAVVLQNLEKLGKMFHVFFQGATGYQMVIQVGENEWEVAEQAIH
jgi:hypothetical protein